MTRSNYSIGITNLKAHLAKHFHIKDLRHLTYFLDQEIKMTAHRPHIDWRNSVEDLVTLAQLTNYHVTDKPLNLNLKFLFDDGRYVTDTTSIIV